jgi:hypothetical protein
MLHLDQSTWQRIVHLQAALLVAVLPTAGQLFLRCDDAWTELADNDGELTVTIRRAAR